MCQRHHSLLEHKLSHNVTYVPQMGKVTRKSRSIARRSFMCGKPTFQGANAWTTQRRSTTKTRKCGGNREEGSHRQMSHEPIQLSGNFNQDNERAPKKCNRRRNSSIPSYLGMAMCSGCGTKAYSGVAGLKLHPCRQCSQVYFIDICENRNNVHDWNMF